MEPLLGRESHSGEGRGGKRQTTVAERRPTEPLSLTWDSRSQSVGRIMLFHVESVSEVEEEEAEDMSALQQSRTPPLLNAVGCSEAATYDPG